MKTTEESPVRSTVAGLLSWMQDSAEEILADARQSVIKNSLARRIFTASSWPDNYYAPYHTSGAYIRLSPIVEAQGCLRTAIMEATYKIQEMCLDQADRGAIGMLTVVEPIQVTIQELFDILKSSKHETTKVHAFDRGAWNALVDDTQWQEYYVPIHMHECILNGNMGSLVGLGSTTNVPMITDFFRSVENFVMPHNTWFVVTGDLGYTESKTKIEAIPESSIHECGACISISTQSRHFMRPDQVKRYEIIK